MGNEVRDAVPRKTETDDQEGRRTLSTDAFKKTESQPDVAKTTDQVAQNDSTKKKAEDPYEHIDKAKEAAGELDLLVQQGRKPDETITVRDGDQLREVRVADRVKELKTTLIREIKAAGDGANAIDQTKADKLILENRQKRDELCKKLGLKPEEISPQRIDGEWQKAKDNPDRRALLRELVPVAGKLDALNLFHYAPMAVKVIEGEYRAKGYMNADLKLGDPVPAAEIKKALSDLNTVKPGSDADRQLWGAGNEVNQAIDVWINAEKTISLSYAFQQQQQAQRIFMELGQAKGDVKEQHLKEALRMAGELDVPFLAREAVRTENLQSGVGAEMMDVIRMGSMARLRMADHLISEEGVKAEVARLKANDPNAAKQEGLEAEVARRRMTEAQKLMIQVKADNPELLYERDENTKELKFRKHEPGGFTYEKLDRAVSLGAVHNPASFLQMQTVLFDQLQKGRMGNANEQGKQFLADLKAGKFNGGDTDQNIFNYLEAKGTDVETFKMMKVYRELYERDIKQANVGLMQDMDAQKERAQGYEKQSTDRMSDAEKAEKTRLTSIIEKKETPAQEKADARKELDKLIDSKLSPDDTVERHRAIRQVENIKVTLDDRQAYLRRIEALTLFTEGVMHLCKGGAQSAHQIFLDAQKADPTLEADLAKLKEQTPDLQTLSELISKTDATWEGYWERNHQKFAKAGGIAAATLTGNLVLGMFSKATFASGATTLLASGAAGAGTNYLIARTGNPAAGMAELKEGAFDGMVMGALSWSPWAVQVSRATAGAKTATDVAALSRMSRIGRTLEGIGVTKGTLAMGFGIAGVSEATDVLVDQKPLDQAATDLLWKGGMNTFMVAITRNWGAAPQAGEIATASRTGLAARLGVKRFWPVYAGAGMAALPQAQNIAEGKPVDLQKFAGDATLNVAALAFLKRWGLDDRSYAHTAQSTLSQRMVTGGRAILMNETFAAGMDRAMKTIYHDLAKQPFYIGNGDGVGVADALIADAFSQYFGELDANHTGDRRVIGQRVDQYGETFGGMFRIDRKQPDPKKRGSTGLFFDYTAPKKEDKPENK